MQTWIAAWVMVFAGGISAAILFNPEERQRNWPTAALMLAVTIAALLAIVHGPWDGF